MKTEIRVKGCAGRNRTSAGGLGSDGNCVQEQKPRAWTGIRKAIQARDPMTALEQKDGANF